MAPSSTRVESDTQPYAVHLLVLCHGLWGKTSHVAYIAKSAAEYAQRPGGPRSARNTGGLALDEDIKLVVLSTKMNEDTLTYDGIDTCAERVVQEIDEEIERIEAQGGVVKRFSILGYSLGGLVARYTLGLLESRTPSFFDAVQPVNFTTFASPAIGIPKYRSFWSSTLNFLGARLLSRTGSQLYGNDRFLLSSIVEGNNQPGGQDVVSSSSPKKQKENATTLLAVMADPKYSFVKALAKFEQIDIYANAVGDRTVPFPTGAIEAHDPFSLARAKAQKAALARGEDPDYVPDIEEGGLEVNLAPDSGLIESFRPITPVSHTPNQPPPSRRRFGIRLPLLLRPTTYPFSRPVSLLIIVCLPLALPLTLMFAIGRFIVQSSASRRRIRQIRLSTGSDRAGMLERVGVRIAEVIDDVAESVQPDNPESAVEEADVGKPSGRQRETMALRHPAFAVFSNYGGTETPELAKPHVPDGDALENFEAVYEKGSKKGYPTDPILTEAQLLMIKNLNSIPGLKKHFAYFPKARNAHGMLIARDLTYPQHREGTKVVDTWAKKFLL